MKWTIGAKIGAGFTLALTALVIVGGVSYRTTARMIDTAASVAHTHEVLTRLDALLSLLTDAETGQRGFIIAGDESYLEPYDSALPKIDQTIREITELTKDNVNQQRRAAALPPLIAEKLAGLQKRITLRRDTHDGFAAAAQEVLTGAGKRVMDQLRAVVGDMESEELTLLTQRSTAAKTSAEQTMLTIVWGTALAAALLLLVGFLITRNISGPLIEMSRVAETIATGDMNVIVADVERTDEVGRLSRAFSRMAQTLREAATVATQIASGDLRATVTPRSDKDQLGHAFLAMLSNLRRMTGELSDGVNVLASSASEILASTTQVAASAAETGTAIAQTTTTVEQVKQTAMVSSQKAKYVADTAQNAIQIGQAGRKAVDSSMDLMKRIQGQMESIAESVVRLSEQSQAIGELIATVNGLAEQSNLLAVNASIEAAKAGEQGKGFSVVAQEVKSLAEQSKQATAQVRIILSDIQNATAAAVLATEQGSKAVEIGMSQSAEAGESIRLLADSMTEAAQAATQIAASSQQQLVGTDQVAIAMANIKQASTQNTAGTRQTETAAHNLHELGQKLRQLILQYKV